MRDWREMFATIELFSGLDLAAEPEKLKAMVHERADALADVPGLITKVWFNDPETREFGAFLLWENTDSFEAFQAAESPEDIGARWGVVPSIKNYEVYQTLLNKQVLR